MTRAGERDQRVRFQLPTETRDSVGELIRDWDDLAYDKTLWASVQFLSGGKESEAAQRIISESRIQIEIDYGFPITVKMRAVWRGRNWNIHSVDPDSRNTTLVILASEVK